MGEIRGKLRTRESESPGREGRWGLRAGGSEDRRLVKEPRGTAVLVQPTGRAGERRRGRGVGGVEAVGSGGERRWRKKGGVKGSKGLHSFR